MGGRERKWSQNAHDKGQSWDNPAEETATRYLGSENTMSLLPAETFYYQFGNQRRVNEPQGQRKTYLCYQLKLLNETLDQGYFKNKKKSHAEMCFIEKISSLDLDQTQRYKITCYVTWSPCPHCAEKLVAFLEDYPHLSLQVFACRLYFHWRGTHQRGLRHLWKSHIPVLAMTEPEFTDYWENFVDNQGMPWEKLKQNSEKANRRLQKILRINTTNLSSEQSSEESQDMNNLVDAVRNLNLDTHHPHY